MWNQPTSLFRHVSLAVYEDIDICVEYRPGSAVWLRSESDIFPRGRSSRQGLNVR